MKYAPEKNYLNIQNTAIFFSIWSPEKIVQNEQLHNLRQSASNRFALVRLEKVK